MLPIQRRYTALFSGEGWTPLVPTEQPGVYASLWEGDGLRLWTLVNREREAVDGPLLEGAVHAGRPLLRPDRRPRSCRDEPRAERGPFRRRSRRAASAASSPAADKDLGADFPRFLARAGSHRTRGPTSTPPRRGAKRGCCRHGRRAAPTQVPDGMVEIPAATLELNDRDARAGVRLLRLDAAGRASCLRLPTSATFRAAVGFKRFAIDETPVTNAQFAEFLKASRLPAEAPGELS